MPDFLFQPQPEGQRMKRYTLTLGAATSAGGKVIAASSHGSINGVRIAVEGDAIFCPACKTTGKIACIGARVPEHWNGKQVGLSGDLCDCGCRPPPRLYACQTLRYQMVEDDQGPPSPAVGPVQPQAFQLSLEDAATLPIRFLHEHDGRPIALQPYRLEFPGKTVVGTTDADGCTTPLTAVERAALIAWHVTGQS
jgi:uncharacterized Zn-binding protein involved in type VI secretion